MKNNFRRLLFGLSLLLILGSFVSGDKVLDFSSLIINRFNKLWLGAPQEKVYLQTDKPYYSAGEDIWFKGFLVNATTHQPTSLSRYLYVELTDKSDSLISRVKIRKDSLGFAGSIKLKPDLVPGYYTLRAFTYWMQNASADFFFNKNIFIGNNIVEGISAQIKFGTPVDGNIPVNLMFTNTSPTAVSPLSGKNVVIQERGGRTFKKKYSYKINLEERINFELHVDSTDHERKSIEVSLDEGGLKYHNRFYLPGLSNDFDLQFFPESGLLLKNCLQKVAFKAIGTDGLSVEVEGKVYSDKNEAVAGFSSLSKGMGSFLLEPGEGTGFYAVAKSSSGLEKRFNLPVAQAEGVALHLAWYGGKIVYEIVNRTNRPNGSLYMLIHSRGKVSAIYPASHLGGKIAESQLPEGINTFAIIDSLGNTLCERLLFNGISKLPDIVVKSDKEAYSRREPVELNLNILSGTGKSSAGNFAISVTDNKMVKQDTLCDNILSYLLLSSDIKGYIEEPASYFAGNPNLNRERLDILMLTQGWRRFSTAATVKGKFVKPGYYLEEGQALSGKVTNILGKPVKKCDVILLSGYKNTVRLAQTDSLGRYLIEGIEFPDSTSFVLKARKKGSLTDVEIVPDPDNFLMGGTIPLPRTGVTLPPAEYFQQSKEKYYYEGGMKAVNLDEVTVVAEKVKSSSPNQYYSGMADNQMTSKDLERFTGMNILTAISMMPGVQVSGTNISIRGSNGNPYILIDGFESQRIDEISYLTTSDVEEISLFKGASASIFGSRGGNGVIAITLKRGIDLNAKKPPPPSLSHIFPLGYQKPTQFYVPKYEVDSVRQNPVPDLRTTLYWNPSLKTDSTGTVHVRFYTADAANNYSITLEGITNEGEICRYTSILKRGAK